MSAPTTTSKARQGLACRDLFSPFFDDGETVLFHGDCREILPHIGDGVLVTDPPFGIGAGPRNHDNGNTPRIIGEMKMNRASDRTIPPEAVALRDEALHLWGNKPALVFGSWRAPRPPGTRMRLVWDKGVIGMGGFGPWRPSDEEIYVIGKGWPETRDTKTVIQVTNTPAGGRCHPNEKPVGLMRALINWCPAGVIVDAFAGSGTTGIAAKELGRQAILIEADEEFCEVAAKRLSQGMLFRENSQAQSPEG